MPDLESPFPSRRSFISTSAGAISALAAGQLQGSPNVKPHQKGKKGLSLIAKKNKAKKILSDLQADWFYGWGPKRPEGIDPKIEFIPMIFSYWGQKQNIKKTGIRTKEKGGKNLLGFNEPDRKKQGNISVEKALKAWPLLTETGLRVGSPSCVHPDGDWMKEFMAKAKAKNLQIDFVCLHSYGSTNAKAFLQRLEKIHRLYQKPIWITEFACGDWSAKSPKENKHKPAAVLRFMETVFPALDKLDYIERYAWFPPSQKNNALSTSALYDSNWQLTRLGEFYRDHS